LENVFVCSSIALVATHSSFPLGEKAMVGVLLSVSSTGTFSHLIHGEEEEASREDVFHTVKFVLVRVASLAASTEYTTLITGSSLSS